MNLDSISEVLATYHGRDKFLRLLTYLGKLGTGITTSQGVALKSQIFASQISGCRVILRLLDDIPMINYVIGYGWGKEEPDWLIRSANLLQNLVDIIYYPIEHVCWAGEKKLLSMNVASLDTATTWCWLISLYLSLVKSYTRRKQSSTFFSTSRSVRKINQLQKHEACLKKTQCDVGVALRLLNAQQRDEKWTTLRLVLDLSYAVSYLPPGVLWGGKMKTWQVGALGTISSLIVLRQMFSKRAASKN